MLGKNFSITGEPFHTHRSWPCYTTPGVNIIQVSHKLLRGYRSEWFIINKGVWPRPSVLLRDAIFLTLQIKGLCVLLGFLFISLLKGYIPWDRVEVIVVLQPDPVLGPLHPPPAAAGSQWRFSASCGTLLQRVTSPEGVAGCQRVADSRIQRSSPVPRSETTGKGHPAPELPRRAARACSS